VTGLDTGLREGTFVGFLVDGVVGGGNGAATATGALVGSFEDGLTGALVCGTITVGARAFLGHPPQRHLRRK
jgi:hypothetical protein